LDETPTPETADEYEPRKIRKPGPVTGSALWPSRGCLLPRAVTGENRTEADADEPIPGAGRTIACIPTRLSPIYCGLLRHTSPALRNGTAPSREASSPRAQDVPQLGLLHQRRPFGPPGRRVSPSAHMLVPFSSTAAHRGAAAQGGVLTTLGCNLGVCMVQVANPETSGSSPESVLQRCEDAHGLGSPTSHRVPRSHLIRHWTNWPVIPNSRSEPKL
jgi:hypothetical protein